MAVHKNKEMIYCSFCGKNQEEVKKIIAGNNVFICDECVELAQEIIREELAEEVLTDLADTPKAAGIAQYSQPLCHRPRSGQTRLGGSSIQSLQAHQFPGYTG